MRDQQKKVTPKKMSNGSTEKEDLVNGLLDRFHLMRLTTPSDDEVAVALFECLKAIEVFLWDAGATWTPAARIWTEATLYPLFRKAVQAPPQRRGVWRRDRNMVLSRLERMVKLAIVLSGSARIVDASHAALAFERLRCYPADSEPMFWCEP